MSRTAPLATALLSLLALGASPAHAFGSVFSPKKFTVSAAGLSLQEWQCNDGIDNDGDGDIDALDSDCDDLGSVPTIDIGGSSDPGGDDVMPIPDFFLALDDTGVDLGLYVLTSETIDQDGDITYIYEVAVSGLASFQDYGLLEGMSAGIVDTDGDQVDDVVLALPGYGSGIIVAFDDVYAGQQTLNDFSGYLYTPASKFACPTSGSGTSATSSYCTSNIAENLLIDGDNNVLLVDLGYADYLGSGIGYRWVFDRNALRSGTAEDGGIAYINIPAGIYYYY